MQISEKLWTAFAQATKAYRDWKTDRAYSSVIGELYQKYPQYKGEIREEHITARYLHSDGFYEGIVSPIREGIERGTYLKKKGREFLPPAPSHIKVR